ncbi:MAG: hypothetical protein FE78DRAFT_116670, partial [Acidomyces sp. 'richmondensis']
TRTRASSHQQYLDKLRRPTDAEVRRISEIQQKKEGEIDSKYHQATAEEHEAATKIQKAYRGHRTRRQLDGLTLDPSARWVEAFKEVRYRTATTSRPRAFSNVEGRRLSPSDQAKANWRKVGQIAERAGAGESSPSRGSTISSMESQSADSMLMDLRYFLEMVDERHRYGTNLQVFHEEWLRSKTKLPFFQWLDHGEGRHMDLPGCSREKLDRERIRYLSREERKDYLVRVDDDGRLRWAKNDELITTSTDEFRDSIHGIVRRDSDEPVYHSEPPEDDDDDIYQDEECVTAIDNDSVDLDERKGHPQVSRIRTPKRHFHVSPATILNHLLRASIKPGTWIYVADTVGRLYVGIKSSGAFQHASFLSGGRISSAGSIRIQDGQLVYLSPLSGHYRPTTKSFKTFITHLKDQGVDLSHLRVSHAYQVLLSMEYYGRTKSGLYKIV